VGKQLQGQTVLLVEDEPFILVDIQGGLEDEGAVVLPALSVGEALEALATERVTAAILDFKLAGGTADDLCHQLVERMIPFVVYSGYSDVDGECRRWEIVQKPADTSELITKLLAALTVSALDRNC
jgi:DNA-binding response OmpR family regulator